MNIIKSNNTIILQNISDFNVKHIFECGQCFRWDKYSDNSYLGVVGDEVLIIEQKGKDIKIYGTNINRLEEFIIDYFDLERDYTSIKNTLRQDEILNKAIDFGWGIRILYQDIWECLISFIISANNRISMIKKTIKNISKMYGNKIYFYDKEFYAFPTCAQFKNCTIEELESCGSGYRARYIKTAVDMVYNKDIDLNKVKLLDTESAKEELKKFPGVGPKVADCILLFSAKKYDVFPTDVWVKRVMEYFYSDKTLKFNEIQDIAREKFGGLSGFAQQYLFYYARELKLGK